MQEYKTMLLAEAEKLHNKFELSKTVTQDYFEPGMMEYLDKHEGLYDQANGIVTLLPHSPLPLRFSILRTDASNRAQRYPHPVAC